MNKENMETEITEPIIDERSRSYTRDALLQYLKQASGGRAFLDEIAAASGVDARALSNAAYNASTRGLVTRPAPKVVQITDLGRTVEPGQIVRVNKANKAKTAKRPAPPPAQPKSATLGTGALLEIVGQTRSGAQVVRSLDNGQIYKIEAL